MTANTFETLTLPLQKYFEDKRKEIDEQSDSRKLFFADFTITMLFAFIKQLKSLRKIVNFISISEEADKLSINPVAFSTLRDGFSRFDSKHFFDLYRYVLTRVKLLKIPSIDELGLLQCVDGSIFPTISSMEWAEYKRTKNAIRLHVSFSLNQMIPLEFLGTKANHSERSFLLDIAKKGVTYIADRGYFSFDLAYKLTHLGAFFVLRIKENIKYSVGKTLNVPDNMPNCLAGISHTLIRFDNDKHKEIYRMVKFKVGESDFTLLTNRLDLSILQIIIIYVYRWQIELLFKFVKRVVNGIHLFNHSKNGVNIQFCLLMILTVLYLNLKQFCFFYGKTDEMDTESVKIKKEIQHLNINNIEDFNTYKGHLPDLWVNSLNKIFNGLWKISSYWVENIATLITKPFDYQTISILASD
jgi:hypothetical protein